MNFRISKRARRQVEKIQAWWLDHRPSAHGLFLEELAAAEKQLRAVPELGSIYSEHPTGVVRRVLLPRTRHHLYYRYQPRCDELTVLAIWGTPKGRAPKL